MPRGLLNIPRVKVCARCGAEFTSRTAGKTWYCDRAECVAARQAARQRQRNGYRYNVAQVRVGDVAHKTELREIARIAAYTEPSTGALRDAVLGFARRPSVAGARLIAAVALVVAADLGEFDKEGV